MYDLIEMEQVTMAAGVPTVWQAMITHIKQNKLRFSTLKKTLIGGSACPPSIISAFKDEHNVMVLHGWGMISVVEAKQERPPLDKGKIDYVPQQE